MPTVLIVEDEAAIAEVLAMLLEDAGYAVVHAANGRVGLEMLAQTQPDLVLSDVMMPVMDGIAFCRAVSAEPRYNGIPVVLMSAARTAIQANECRYAAFITKPFDVLTLIQTIQKLIGGV